ncbi:MAG TPA: PHP domain-containing protein [Candidatus Micrarchaeia archaeon]|nr:PHP domain-containing protein [Candidatus Micrarchaeia archaeon]
MAGLLGTGAGAVPPGFAVADPHLHTTRSDGMVSPRELVRAAARAGLGVICVTDHDTTAGVAEAGDAGAEFGVEVVAGEEVTTKAPGRVHVLGLFLDGPVRMGLTVADTIRAIRDRGGLAVLAHPFMPTYFASITPAGLRRLIARERLDGIELRHTSLTTRGRARALDAFYAANRDALGAAVGSSDSHFGGHDLARTVTAFPGLGAADFRRALEAGLTRPIERYAHPPAPALQTRLRQQARSLGWLSWQRWRGRVGQG